MADQPTVFEERKETPKDLISELVGEGKKYKTTEDLARGRLEADIHIKRLEEEAKVLRDQVAAAKSVDDILAAIQAKAASEGTPLEPKDEGVDTKVLPSAGLTAEQVAKIVAEQLKGSETAKQKEVNRQKSNDLMKQMFGDRAQEKFNSKATSPELRATLVQLAEVNPTDFISLFKEQGTQSVVDSGSHLNVLNVPNTTGSAEQGTQLYYSEMRKKNPKQYYSPAVQLEMHNAAMKDPNRYFGRNA